MKVEELREGMRVRNAFQPKVTGTVRRIGGGEFQRRLRAEAGTCEECLAIPDNIWTDGHPPIPDRACIRHSGAERASEGWVMVEWDVRKGLLVAANPAVLEPEIDLRVH